MLMRYQLPFAGKGQRIGLLGGSFDPAHQGHVHISKWALKALQLDKIWWIVSPQNPSKLHKASVLERRINYAHSIIDHPKIAITNIESHFQTHFTCDTLLKIKNHYPHSSFIWIMGADNFSGFHRWKNWRFIFKTMPIAVMARPLYGLSSLSSPAARCFFYARKPASYAPLLPQIKPPSWVYLNGAQSSLSSTRLREKGLW